MRPVNQIIAASLFPLFVEQLSRLPDGKSLEPLIKLLFRQEHTIDVKISLESKQTDSPKQRKTPFHGRNLYNYAGESERILSVKKRHALAL